MKPTSAFTTVIKKDNSSSAETAEALWTPASGNRIVVLAIIISSLTAQTTKFLLDSTDVTPIFYTGASDTKKIDCSGYPVIVGAANEVLKYTTTAGVATSIMIVGYEENVNG
jgi:hypothetical protein